MPSNTLLEVTCSHCQHTWQQDISQLQVEDQPIYRDAKRPKIERYRVRCPKCGRYTIITVQVEAG